MSGNVRHRTVLKSALREFYECRVCGENVGEDTQRCPQCDSTEIATYLLE